MPKRRRRAVTAEFKARIVLRDFAVGGTPQPPSSAFRPFSGARISGLGTQGHIAVLERRVGRLTRELEVARKALCRVIRPIPMGLGIDRMELSSALAG